MRIRLQKHGAYFSELNRSTYLIVVSRGVTICVGETGRAKMRSFCEVSFPREISPAISFKISKNLHKILENSSLETLNNWWFQPTSLWWGSFNFAYCWVLLASRKVYTVSLYFVLCTVHLQSWSYSLSVLQVYKDSKLTLSVAEWAMQNYKLFYLWLTVYYCVMVVNLLSYLTYDIYDPIRWITIQMNLLYTTCFIVL